MRIGIASPVLVQVPGVGSAWERTAGIEQVAHIAAAADRLGFHHVSCSEHVAVPTGVAEQRGATYWDPLATLGFLAARTNSIRLVTQVLVLGYHHPLEIAKRYGTLDAVSGGRLTLGVGVGSLQEEFDLLGAPFSDRGVRADEALLALRASLSQRTPEFHGEFYEFADFVVEPHAVQSRVPIWVGGRTLRSLRRAVNAGDGWVPFGLDTEQLTGMLSRVERPAAFDVVLSTGSPVDPIGNPDRTRRALDRAVGAGASIVGVSIAADSPTHYVEQLDALSQLYPQQGGER